MTEPGIWRLLAADWVVMATVMTALWIAQRRTGDAGVVDVGWAGGLAGSAVAFALLVDQGLPARRWMVAGMASVWGGRLAWHLLVDRVLPEGEDGRYRRAREQWGDRSGLYLFLFFQLQALLVPLLGGAFLLAMRHPAESLRGWDALGVGLWLVALVGEWVADRQLARFRRRPETRGEVCREGLWRYSRHPNYFFEWIHWWAYVAIAAGYPAGWAALYAPLLMLFFVLRLTGIPPTEAEALRSRGEAYRRYRRTTSAFFPWPPGGGED